MEEFGFFIECICFIKAMSYIYTEEASDKLHGIIDSGIVKVLFDYLF